MKKHRLNDVIEIPNCCHVSLNAYIWSFQVLGLFLQYLMFFLRDNQQGILSYQSQQLPCRAREAQAHYLFSHLPFRMDSFVHGNVLSYR